MSKEQIPPFTTVPPAEFAIPEMGITFSHVESGDEDKLLAFAADPAARQYVPWAGRVQDAESAHKIVEEFSSAYERGVMASYLVEKDNEFAGYARLWSDREPGLYEFGFGVLPEFRGHGVGTAIATRILELVEHDLHGDGMVAYIDDTNAASKAVALSLGFKPTEEFDGSDRRYILHFK